MLGIGIGPPFAVPRGRRVAAFDLLAALPPGAMLTRASPAAKFGALGQVVVEPVDVARFDHDPVTGAPRGLLVERAATNKCGEPASLAMVTGTANLAIVDDGAALAAAGLSALMPGGQAIRIDNSGNASSATLRIGGQAGTLVEHGVSMFARGGAGLFGLGNSTGGFIPGGSAVLPASATYRRVAMTSMPDTAARTMLVRANPGEIVLLVMNQLEEGAPTSPVVAGATRAGDQLSLAWGMAGVADGAVIVRYTFDDGGTQDVATTIANGRAVVPMTLARPHLTGARIA